MIAATYAPASKLFLFPCLSKDGKYADEDAKDTNKLDNICVPDITLGTNVSPNTASRFKDRLRMASNIFQDLNLKSRSALLATRSTEEKQANA